ncbi:CusA/CzcA family heavy metal efflux RND transporter [Chondrinema litorale]|uniref:CusA/CzcA family heavy metal efflux RND transporter n=1 Tax=Chondrinema litorale TaxID=2994555 RepID=UPI00254319EC|nr:CusA/CzcA family heavy metal efflux RND transporter [Chondrinema litorale]UZR97480.1 CusA/CzcA family heavy metal efflux RND transporter [Chondrinema litorale]
MIKHIIAFSVQNKLLVAMLMVVLIIGGIWSITKIPIDAVPDITNNQVQVITQAPNLGTEDIEQFVTYPIELAMSNLPGVTEIRSISRFGLSVVTIVFEDGMDTYLPRQLVSEKLPEIEERIPDGFGKPHMGPISTGLGEIYQYTLDVDSAHQDKYSASDLRTIQDWIIRRQMAMIPGVVEINAFGGKIKQYEVKVNPDELNAMGLNIADVFSALQENNQNTGGAYIEKEHRANFIRGEGLARNISDIEDIVVKNVNDIPITIKDIAKVQFGSAPRYGTFTKNGKGEAVGGMVLMLKGANSNDVINQVITRIDEIQKSLPEGVKIEPFLDRSNLIIKTTSTVSRNLLEGALIVIFVLVFLLGNWRGGFIVASTIPLSLLFAFILMNAFGVWANLMSLGAIDFGIIVDGAVIIVESSVYLLSQKVLKHQEIDKETRNQTAIEASSKMMRSAFFGQLIILIVFIPILALEGVEGKMFQPMALTFMFAMLGVMILCLTYVPMMSAWFLRVNKDAKPSLGDKVVIKIENLYEKLLTKALRRAKWVILVSASLLAFAVFIFFKLGGEFIPQLDEGDIAFHIILKPGSSLTQAVSASTKVEKLLLENFPEIDQALSRFGVADVPTDPMPMDIGDCFLILKPKSEWVSAESKDELIANMKEVLGQLPGINYEFTQPIEMRFNELITGVREDIAVKLFGEDLALLASKAEEMGKIIAGIPGVADMKVEATSGLPQMTVKYNRHKIAQYNVNIEDLNRMIQAAFAGGKAGVIFEGEKRFDLVVRLDETYRKNIDNLENLYIDLPSGNRIPLKEVADISYEEGPMQISRDNTNRRVYVGVNVRENDIQTVTQEIQRRLDARLDLPPGYYIRYGGAFENLERASKRLQVLVPAAMALIFVLIFFALRSVRQTIMIYIAIPLAAIGGVLSLWLRDMPFSISAGIGFIVLFGVAVLNGLVLVSGWNELKEEGVSDLRERIETGAKRRIRPILLTALTDILGFLPMAISTSSGAEVQRPLATVVIGGMITATFLTLFALPILYRWVEKWQSNPRTLSIFKKTSFTVILILLCVLMQPKPVEAQDKKTVSELEEAIVIAKENNGNLHAAKTNIKVEEAGKKEAINLNKTDFGIQYGQYNSFENDFSININQSFELPMVYAKRKNLADAKVESKQLQVAVIENDLIKDIKKAWYQLAFLEEKKKLMLFQDSVYSEFLRAAKLRYETGATSYLEQAASETKTMEVRNQLKMIEADIAIQESKLQTLLNDSSEINFEPPELESITKVGLQNASLQSNNPMVSYTLQQSKIAQAEQQVASAKMLPEFSIGYFNQSMIGTETSNGEIASASDRFTGIQAGISIPLFFGSYKAGIQAAKLREQASQQTANYYQSVVKSQYDQQRKEVDKYLSSLEYYQGKALSQADLIIENAQKSMENGAIGYVEYFQLLNQAISIRFNYLENLNGYNQAIISLEYLAGN